MALWSMLISSSIVCVKISNVCAKLHIFKVDKVDVCNGMGSRDASEEFSQRTNCSLLESVVLHSASPGKN